MDLIELTIRAHPLLPFDLGNFIVDGCAHLNFCIVALVLYMNELFFHPMFSTAV